jgi:RNA polymerase sigma-70 factor, ECF subfamily
MAQQRHLKHRTEHLSSKQSSAAGYTPGVRNSTTGRFDGASLRKTVHLAKHGDAAAFETLYQLYARRVYALCLRMLRDPSEAKDALQDAFLQLFRRVQTFRGESAFSTWLYRLTFNVVLMRLRRKKANMISLDEMMKDGDKESNGPYGTSGPDLRLAGVVDRVTLRAAIGKLPAGYKRTLVLHDVQAAR